MRRIADQVIVFMDPLEGRGVKSEADRPLFEDNVVFGAVPGARQRKLGRGELVADREVVDRAGVEQERDAPVDRDGVTGYEARVPGEEADRACGLQRGAGDGDHELRVMVY